MRKLWLPSSRMQNTHGLWRGTVEECLQVRSAGLGSCFANHVWENPESVWHLNIWDSLPSSQKSESHDKKIHPRCQTPLMAHTAGCVKISFKCSRAEGENLYVDKQTATSPLLKFLLRIMFWSMSQQSLCESKLATFPWKLLNCLREVLFWSEIFKCAVLRVCSQSWKSSGNSWAMNPFCSNPVSEWRGDDDKHSTLNISCPAFSLAFSSMALDCWLMRHQHCFVSIHPSMDVFEDNWQPEMEGNMSINTTSLKTRQQNVLEIVEIYSVGHHFLEAINQVTVTSGLFQLFSLSTWRDEHGLKTSEPNAFKNTPISIQLLHFSNQNYVCNFFGQMIYIILYDDFCWTASFASFCRKATCNMK